MLQKNQNSPIFGVDRSQDGNVFSIEVPLKVLQEFFEVKFKAWLTSIGLRKMSRAQIRKRIKMESWYLKGKSNQAQYKRDSTKVSIRTGFPECKKRSLQIILNEIISVSPHFKKKSKVIEYLFRPGWQIHLKTTTTLF